MSSEACEATLETQHLRKLLRHCLERQQAVNLQGLMESLGMPRQAVMEELIALMEKGEVEVLTPLFGEAGNPAGTCVFYRLVRETDGDFLWQQERRGPVPLTRMFEGGVEAVRGAGRAPVRRASPTPSVVAMPALNWA